MAKQIQLSVVEAIDDTPGPTVRVRFVSTVTTDDPLSIAIGGITVSDVRQGTVSRAAYDAFRAACQRDKTDTWPDGVLAHPIAKAP